MKSEGGQRREGREKMRKRKMRERGREKIESVEKEGKMEERWRDKAGEGKKANHKHIWQVPSSLSSSQFTVFC